MRQLATIQRIEEVLPIDGADAIEKVRVKDWWCVSKKDEFKQNDVCVYFEIDSLLPSSNESFSFLSRGTKEKTMTIDGVEYKGYRLRTIKLRGQISQGLALPVAMFPEILSSIAEPNFGAIDEFIGEDVSEVLNIVKYEPPLPAQLVGKVKGNFPSFLHKTDEERIQNLGWLVEKYQGTIFYVTEKLDGSSATFYRHTTVNEGDHFGVCSRNLELLDTEGNTFWDVAKKYGLSERLPNGFAVQCELVGEGIQKNPLKLKGHDIYVYNVYDIIAEQYLDFETFKKFVSDIGLKTVPVLDGAFELRGDVNAVLKIADGKSMICADTDREGIVLRPLTEMREQINGTDARLSFKAISNSYLLNEQ